MALNLVTHTDTPILQLCTSVM